MTETTSILSHTPDLYTQALDSYYTESRLNKVRYQNYQKERALAFACTDLDAPCESKTWLTGCASLIFCLPYWAVHSCFMWETKRRIKPEIERTPSPIQIDQKRVLRSLESFPDFIKEPLNVYQQVADLAKQGVGYYKKAFNKHLDHTIEITKNGHIFLHSKKLLGTGTFGVVKLSIELYRGGLFARKTSKEINQNHLKKEISIYDKLKGLEGIPLCVHKAEFVSQKGFKKLEFLIPYFPKKIEDLKDLPEATKECILQKLEEIIRSVHKKGVAHNDISLRNTLLSEDNKPYIIDFGQAVLKQHLPDLEWELHKNIDIAYISTMAVSFSSLTRV